MYYLIFLILSGLALTAQSGDCEVTGDVNLWIYDRCYSIYETKNSKNEYVINCVNDGLKEISVIGDCASKIKSKEFFCEIGTFHSGTYKDCMDSSEYIGPAIKRGKP